MISRCAALAAMLTLAGATTAAAQARPPVPTPSARMRIDVNANVTSILQNVVNLADPYDHSSARINARVIIWEDPDQATELPARPTFQRPTDPAALKQWLDSMLTRPDNPSGAELDAMTPAEFADFMAHRKPSTGAPQSSNQNNIVAGAGDDDSDTIVAPASLPSLQSEFDTAMAGTSSGDYDASSLDGGSFTVANVLPIYIGYAVAPNGAAMTSLNVQVQTPSTVMVVPSTQITGMPTDVMTVASSQVNVPSTQVNVPSTQVNVPSTQVDAPSPVMQSPDLEPALCGR